MIGKCLLLKKSNRGLSGACKRSGGGRNWRHRLVWLKFQFSSFLHFFILLNLHFHLLFLLVSIWTRVHFRVYQALYQIILFSLYVMIIDGGNPVGLMYSELPTSGAPAKLVHNCTIFLCSLDVRNMIHTEIQRWIQGSLSWVTNYCQIGNPEVSITIFTNVYNRLSSLLGHWRTHLHCGLKSLLGEKKMLRWLGWKTVPKLNQCLSTGGRIQGFQHPCLFINVGGTLR